MVCAGCVVVGEPSLESGTTGPSATESSSGGTGLESSSADSSGESPSSSSSSSEAETGEAPPVEATEFEVLWTGFPAEAAPSADFGGTIRTDAYDIPWVSYGAHPRAVEDREALYAEIDAGVASAIPDPEAEGFGVLPQPSWVPAWCGSTDAARDGFAASEYGQGLAGLELEAAFEAEALEVLLEIVARARAARPNVKWGIHGVPKPEYWKIVDNNDDDTYEAWRTCNVSSPAPRELWDAVDFTAPELRYFYPLAINGSHNESYVSRWVESMRLAGKPVYPLLGGRFLDSGSGGKPPTYVGLPYYPEDVELVLTELRNAGANGLIYDLEVEGCWDFENGCGGPPAADPEATFEDYWTTVFSPVLATFDET